METKIETRSLVLGAFIGAVAVLCVAAATNSELIGTARRAVQGRVGDASLPAKTNALEQVTGIGGVFFKAQDPKGLVAWYRTNLGVRATGGYADFTWREKERPEEIGHTAWRIFPTNTAYFGEARSPLMINYRVANLERMLEQLRRGGVKVEKVENHDFGRWAWVTDPEGNRIELWEPKGK